MGKKIVSLLMALCLMLGCISALAEEVTVPNITTTYQYEIPDNEAMAFVKDMKIGWNLGNTFDANSDHNPKDDMKIESSWVGVMTTRK